MDTLRVFFNWPVGSIWSNIIASILWVVPGYFWGRFHVRKLHKRFDNQDQQVALLHHRIKRMHGKLGVK